MSYSFRNSSIKIQNLPFFKSLIVELKSVRQLILGVQPLVLLPYNYY